MSSPSSQRLCRTTRKRSASHPDGGTRSRSIHRSLADNPEIQLTFQQRPQPLPDQVMVIRQHDGDGVHRWSSIHFPRSCAMGLGKPGFWPSKVSDSPLKGSSPVLA